MTDNDEAEEPNLDRSRPLAGHFARRAEAILLA